jgi:hypothetical protein
MDWTVFFADVLNAALSELHAAPVPVYTFALYHDHESAAVSVCVDTETRSRKTVQDINRLNLTYFLKAVETGDLRSASLWQANIGRSLSLGDFAMVNVARTSLPAPVDEKFYVAMVRALVSMHTEIARVSAQPEQVVLACSSAEDEVGYVWSLPLAS